MCPVFDTACSKISSNPNNKRIERWPDVIAIGTAKCGTGSLSFIDCHPNVVFREYEADFFMYSDDHQNLHEYEIPHAAVDEILIEKSPQYLYGTVEKLRHRAQRMIQMNPDLKILIFVCDPVKRYNAIPP